MKIAIFFPKDSEAVFNKKSSSTFGGATAQLFNISKALFSINNRDVFSIISDYSHIDFDDSENFNLVSTFNNKDNFILKILKFHNALKSIKPDFLIQRGLTFFSCLLALYCKFFGIKLMFMFAHDNEVNGRYQKNNKKCPLFKLLLKYSSILVTQSNEQREKLFSFYKFNSTVIKSGYFLEGKDDLKKEYILWVSRLEPWKRPELYLKLAEEFPDEKFVMIGPIFRGYEDYGKEIQLGAAQIKNVTYIEFVPFNKINGYFKRAKVFINTSESEGFPNTFIQSFVSSTPVISLKVDPDQVLEQNKCGFSANDSMKSLSLKLKNILNDKELYDEVSELSYNYARNNHDIAGSALKIFEEAKKILNKKI